MVKQWMKNLIILSKNTDIDFDKIVQNILIWNYIKYDFKELSGYKNLYRVRIWWYRIIFSKNINDISIILIWNRWNVYKKLKQIY